MSHLLTPSFSFLISGIGGGSICAYKVTTCDTIYGSPIPSHYMIINLYPVWINEEVQAWIEPPPIPTIKNEIDDVSECDIIKIKIHQNLSDANSETYKLNIAMFEHEQPEEFLMLMKCFNSAVDGTNTNLEAGKIYYLLTLLGGEEL